VLLGYPSVFSAWARDLWAPFLSGSFFRVVSHTLFTVSDKATVTQGLTPIFESFRNRLEKVSAGGDTVVYDALEAARKVLVNYRTDLPKLRKRIVIVTDGEDTSSEASAKDVCHALQKSSIIVDSIQVGHKSDSTLHGISVATGTEYSSPPWVFRRDVTYVCNRRVSFLPSDHIQRRFEHLCALDFRCLYPRLILNSWDFFRIWKQCYPQQNVL
jgi:hypothetical protein